MDAESEDGKGNKRDVSTKIQVDIGAYRDESNTKTTKEQTNHSLYPQGPMIYCTAIDCLPSVHHVVVVIKLT